MVNYTVGDKVLCLTDHSTNPGNIQQYIFKGNYYIVRAMKTCSCGLVIVDIGMNLTNNEYTSCDCGNKLRDGIWWFKNTRFTKEGEDTTDESTETETTVDISEFMEVFTSEKEKI